MKRMKPKKYSKQILSEEQYDPVTNANFSTEPTFKELCKTLTPYELTFLQAFLGEANFNASKAEQITKRVHSTKNAQKVNAHRTLQRLQPVIARWLDEMNISEVTIKVKLLQKLEAKEILFFKHRGKVVETREVDDNATQIKALELTMKAKGMLNPKIPKYLDRLIEIELEKIAASLENQT